MAVPEKTGSGMATRLALTASMHIKARVDFRRGTNDYLLEKTRMNIPIYAMTVQAALFRFEVLNAKLCAV
jgi:hypothetical protein